MKHDPSILILFFFSVFHFISFDLAYFSYGLYKFSVLLLLLNSPIRFSNIIYSIFFLSLLILFGHWVNRLCCCCCYYYCFSFSFLMWANKNLNLNWISEFITSFMFVTIFRFFFFLQISIKFCHYFDITIRPTTTTNRYNRFSSHAFLSISNGKEKKFIEMGKKLCFKYILYFQFCFALFVCLEIYICRRENKLKAQKKSSRKSQNPW